VTSAPQQISYTRLVLGKRQRVTLGWIGLTALSLAVCAPLYSQSASPTTRENHVGYVPVISGGVSYVHNVNGGVTTVEPLASPVLLVPFGSNVLLESRTDFTGCIFTTFLLALISGQILYAASSKSQSEQNNSKQAQPSQSTQADPDQVFNTHCGRCHTPPLSISLRITGTVIMHMRMRARLSREDEIPLLKYMAP